MTKMLCPVCKGLVHWYRSDLDRCTKLCYHDAPNGVQCDGSAMPTTTAARYKAGERNENNTGYGAYIGRKRVAWSLDFDAVVDEAVEAVKKVRTKDRFVPCAVIFDQAIILNLAFVTDDGNGVTVHAARGLGIPEDSKYRRLEVHGGGEPIVNHPGDGFIDFETKREIGQ